MTVAPGQSRLFLDYCAGDAAARAFYASLPPDPCRAARPPVPAHWAELVRLLAEQNSAPSPAAAAALAALRANLANLGIAEGFTIHSGSAGGWLRKAEKRPEAGARAGQSRAFDLVFLDPPYEAVEEYAATLGLLGGGSAELLAPGALVIAEHRRKERLGERYGALGRTRLLEQGDAALSFYAAGPG